MPASRPLQIVASEAMMLAIAHRVVGRGWGIAEARATLGQCAKREGKMR